MAIEDVRPYEMAFNDHFYLWHDFSSLRQHTDSCIITAHGDYWFPLHDAMRLGHEDVRLLYYVPHKHMTPDMGLSAFGSDWNLDMVVERSNPQLSNDYLLYKYTNTKHDSTKHNQAGESYRTVKAEVVQRQIDIITIRSHPLRRPLLFGTRLSSVLKTLWEHGFNYQEFRCAFCRGGKSFAISQRTANEISSPTLAATPG